MSFFEKIKSFFALAKDSNFNILKVYEQDSNGTLIFLLVVLILIFIIIYLIRRAIKVSSTVKLVSNIQSSKNIDDYDLKLTKIVTELPKRGLKVANSINSQKNDILNQELSLLKNLDISDKVARYQQISNQYALMAKNSAKYKIEDLTSFYEEKSKTLLNENLANEIEIYYKNAEFNENDVNHINTIVSYANSIDNPDEIITPLKNEIDRCSYGYNLEFYRFIKGLDKDKASDIYKHCHAKLKDLFTSQEGVVSEKLLNYMLKNDEKDNVYNYISTLKNKTHLTSLYNNMFAKTEEIALDLAFIENETKIDVDYKTHIDNKLTENWKDLAYIKYIIESKGVLETIGHIDYRNVLERIEKLETQDGNNKAIAQALEIARRAETIANEAKALARNK